MIKSIATVHNNRTHKQYYCIVVSNILEHLLSLIVALTMSNNGSSVASDTVMVEDAWYFEDDIAMDCDLTANVLRTTLLGKKSKHQFLRDTYKNKPGLYHEWSREQTNCLWQKLNSGDYNLSRIQRMNTVLKRITLMELHDRAIVLLMFRRCLILDPVGFFHCDKPHEHQYMLKTWLCMTQTYREHYYVYHEYNGSMLQAPDRVKTSFKIHIMKGFRILTNYNKFYYEGTGGFRFVFNDVLEMNMDLATI